jgi:hypothetical protein
MHHMNAILVCQTQPRTLDERKRSLMVRKPLKHGMAQKLQKRPAFPLH